MPRQNRVTPLGELVADPARGLVYGNRGCLHDEDGRIRRGFNGKRWIACRLEFRGRRRGRLMQPGRYTELFFLDEATAFAAGHRPCAECRREDYVRFQAIWRELHAGPAGADAIDARLHAERLVPGTRAQRHHDAARSTSFRTARSVFLREGVSRLVLGGGLLGPGPERRLRRANAAAGARARSRDHTAVTRLGVAGRLAADRSAPPSVSRDGAALGTLTRSHIVGYSLHTTAC